MGANGSMLSIIMEMPYRLHIQLAHLGREIHKRLYSTECTNGRTGGGDDDDDNNNNNKDNNNHHQTEENAAKETWQRAKRGRLK